MKRMTSSEKVENLAKEVRTYEILQLIKDCKTVDEAIEKIKALLVK